MNAEAIWIKADKIIQGNLNETSYKTWFSKIKGQALRGDVFILQVENEITKNLLENMYIEMLTQAVTAASGKLFKVDIVVGEKEKKVTFSPEEKGDLPLPSSLDEKYTFSNFIVGPNSEFAHAASMAVTDNPATKYNPLLIYGGTGLGKTHLMTAIGLRLREKHPSWRILYITSEKFTNDLIEAIQKKTTTAFRDLYRNTDILLIDDIQFFANKERSQEEFFHTFNELKTNGKQIILTSDRPPKDIYPLEERLRTRIEGGLMADIQPPDFETRLAILKNKIEIEMSEASLPNDVLDLIATQIKSNIRELEGAIKKIIAYKEISHKDIDLKMAAEILNDYFSTVRSQHIDADYVIKTVENYFNLHGDTIVSNKRDKKIVYPRQIAMYICRELTDMSYPQIGKEFGGRDHSTVMHSINKISKEIETNLSTLNTINELLKKIQD